jgi:regulator of protease activity HflC (stomatin/prohibitin superfamily)
MDNLPQEIKKHLPLIILFIIFILPMFGKYAFVILIFLVVIFIISQKFKYNFDKSNLNSDSIKGAIDLGKLNFMNNMKKNIAFAVVGVLALWLFFSSIVIVEAGYTGVYSLFGKVKDDELKSGFHLVIPLAHVYQMSIRTEEYTMSITKGEGQKYAADAISSLTKEGLSVDLDMTVLYKLNEEKASDVYRELGLQYAEKIIRPTIRTVIRDIIAQYTAKDIYSDKREEVADKITQKLVEDLEKRGLIVENVLLRNVILPSGLTQSIQEKLQAEQEAQKYDFLLEKEQKEKERKVIEAEGQRDAQKIINESLTTNYLYYSYIKELKDREGTIYVPTGSNTGVPLFRNLGL